MTGARVPGPDLPGGDAAVAGADRTARGAQVPGPDRPGTGERTRRSGSGSNDSGMDDSGTDDPGAVAPPSAARSAADATARVAELALARPARLGPVRLVCVDGPAGSGKSTFAGVLAAHLEARGVRAAVLHLDDLYAGWSGLDGDLAPRLAAQVLEPLRRGWAGRYQRYDWMRERFADWVDVPVPEVLVVEGCGAGRRDVAVDAAALVWVEAPATLRLDRGLERDGAAMRPQWERWMLDEQVHFARERTPARADVRLDAYGRMVG